MYQSRFGATGNSPVAGKHPSRHQLLPLPRKTVNEFSLRNHLALAACRREVGNAHLLNYLIHAVYITFFLQQAGYGALPGDLYRRAEEALLNAVLAAKQQAKWAVDVDAAFLLEQILATHDAQLENVSAGVIDEARRKLTRYIVSNSPSPIQTFASV